jgi:hypothetical protein
MRKKIDFSSFELPDAQRRRGSFVIRIALKEVILKQHPAAMKAAGRLLLVLPFVQGALLVGILDAEPWMLFLCAEGLLIAWLAASQLKRPSPENRLIGFGVGVVNVGAVSAVGAFLGVPILWITGLLALLPFCWLLLRPTRRRTIAASWTMFAIPLLVLLVFAGYTRAALERSHTETNPQARLMQLGAAWHGLRLRGGNGTERALLRLRQAQSAFEAGYYDAAFHYADDGVRNDHGGMRGIPDSPLGGLLVDSLLGYKAQAFYNQRWEKEGPVQAPIRDESISDELLLHPSARVRWGW